MIFAACLLLLAVAILVVIVGGVALLDTTVWNVTHQRAEKSKRENTKVGHHVDAL